VSRQLRAQRVDALDHRRAPPQGLREPRDRTGLDAEERHHAVAGELVRDAPAARDRRATVSK
jgi:hypothetical protein